MLSYVAKHSKLRKTTKVITLDVKTSRNDELRRKTFKTSQNYEIDQIIMNWIDLTSKGSKMLSYVANHSKQRQTTKVIKKQWLASIWWQNDQSNAKLWTWSNYNELHRFDVQTIKNVELRRRTFKTAKLQKWSNWTSKRSKMLSYVVKPFKTAKLQKR